MENKSKTSDNNGFPKKWQKISIISTLGAAVATLIIAVMAYLQFESTKGTREIMAEEFRLSQKPELLLHGEYDKAKPPITWMDRKAEATERWKLPYYVINIGDKPAYRIFYTHSKSKDSNFVIPADSTLQTQHINNVVFPSMSLLCGYDELYRQEVLDAIDDDYTFYRHFYVKYEDKAGHIYKYVTSWRLYYEMGKLPEWSVFRYEDLMP
jgi:hypothetical protein